MTAKVGFIGLGIMGKPMSLNLLRAGYPLWVYARRLEAMQPLVDAGAQACASCEEVASRADVVFIMVADSPDVEEVVAGEKGVIHAARKGLVVIDMSTISPSVAKRLAAEMAQHGVEMLDAPVSGGETGAIQGTLSIMVGGKKEIFTEVKPLLECLGRNIVHVGHRGAGQVAKACNQMLVALTMEGVAEAIAFARKNGVDPHRVREALLGGFANSRILEVHGKRMLDADYKPGFKVKLHQKDLRIVLEEARQLGLALPGAALMAQHMNKLVGSGDGELDSSAIMKIVEKMSSECK